jgi:hypothetical protein
VWRGPRSRLCRHDDDGRHELRHERIIHDLGDFGLSKRLTGSDQKGRLELFARPTSLELPIVSYEPSRHYQRIWQPLAARECHWCGAWVEVGRVVAIVWTEWRRVADPGEVAPVPLPSRASGLPGDPQ